MSKFIDYTGQKFGKLTVTHLADPYVSPSGNKVTKWACSCECGTTNVIVAGAKLKNGQFDNFDSAVVARKSAELYYFGSNKGEHK